MNETEAKAIAQQLFGRLRRELNLGTGEYLAVLDAIDGGFAAGEPGALRRLLSLLWCSSAAAQGRLQVAWEEAIATVEPAATEPAGDSPPERVEREPPPPRDDFAPAHGQDPGQQDAAPRPQATQPAPQPIQAPPLPAEPAAVREFAAAWPVSRRQMAYGWRYLRRPVADGPATVLDVAATVEQAARAGVFLRPVYRRRERNRAHLLLLIDQEGSMMPMHRWTRQLVETARDESRLGAVDVAYFYNIPGEYLYHDPHLTQPVRRQAVLAGCDRNTCVAIASDAGAARGYRRLERVRALAAVLLEIRDYTQAVVWLNPLPRDRWPGSSAQILARLVRMEPLDEEGLTAAIAYLQTQLGQPSP